VETIGVAEAKARFSELVSRAAAGERFVIERRLRPLATVVGAAEWDRLERRSRAAHKLALALGQDAELMKQIQLEEVHPAMAAFGLWGDEEELETLAREISDNRQRQASRAELSM